MDVSKRRDSDVPGNTPSPSSSFSQLDYYLKTHTLHHEMAQGEGSPRGGKQNKVVTSIQKRLSFVDRIKAKSSKVSLASSINNDRNNVKDVKDLELVNTTQERNALAIKTNSNTDDNNNGNSQRKILQSSRNSLRFSSKMSDVSYRPLSSHRRRASFHSTSSSLSKITGEQLEEENVSDTYIKEDNRPKKRHNIRHNRSTQLMKEHELRIKTKYKWWSRDAARQMYNSNQTPIGAILKLSNIFFSASLVLLYMIETKLPSTHPLGSPTLLTVIEFICALFFFFDFLLVLYCGELNRTYTNDDRISEGSFLNALVYIFTEGFLDLIVIVPVFAYVYENGFAARWVDTVPCQMEEHIGLCWKCYDMNFDVCSDTLTQPLRSLRYGIFLNFIKNLRLLKIFLIFHPNRLRSVLNGTGISEPFVLYVVSFMAQFSCIVFIFASLFYMVDIQMFPFANKGEIRLTAAGNPIAFGDCIYFILVTLATVGYGDISPMSAGGYAVVVVVIVLCLCYVPNQVTKTLDMYQRGIEAQLHTYKSKQHASHIIIIGPISPLRVQVFAREFFHNDRFASNHESSNISDIIIFSPDVKTARMTRLLIDPDYWSRIHYVRGSIDSREDLRRAGFFHKNCHSCLMLTNNEPDDTVTKFVLLKAFARKFHAPNKTLHISAQCEYRAEAENLVLYTDSHKDIFACVTEIYNTILAAATRTPGLIAFYENILHTHSKTLYSDSNGNKVNKNDFTHYNEYLEGATMEVYFIEFPSKSHEVPFQNIVRSLCINLDEHHRPIILLGIRVLS